MKYMNKIKSTKVGAQVLRDISVPEFESNTFQAPSRGQSLLPELRYTIYLTYFSIYLSLFLQGIFFYKMLLYQFQ